MTTTRLKSNRDPLVNESIVQQNTHPIPKACVEKSKRVVDLDSKKSTYRMSDSGKMMRSFCLSSFSKRKATQRSFFLFRPFAALFNGIRKLLQRKAHENHFYKVLNGSNQTLQRSSYLDNICERIQSHPEWVKKDKEQIHTTLLECEKKVQGCQIPLEKDHLKQKQIILKGMLEAYNLGENLSQTNHRLEIFSEKLELCNTMEGRESFIQWLEKEKNEKYFSIGTQCKMFPAIMQMELVYIRETIKACPENDHEQRSFLQLLAKIYEIGLSNNIKEQVALMQEITRMAYANTYPLADKVEKLLRETSSAKDETTKEVNEQRLTLLKNGVFDTLLRELDAAEVGIRHATFLANQLGNIFGSSNKNFEFFIQKERRGDFRTMVSQGFPRVQMPLKESIKALKRAAIEPSKEEKEKCLNGAFMALREFAESHYLQSTRAPLTAEIYATMAKKFDKNATQLEINKTVIASTQFVRVEDSKRLSKQIKKAFDGAKEIRPFKLVEACIARHQQIPAKYLQRFLDEMSTAMKDL